MAEWMEPNWECSDEELEDYYDHEPNRICKFCNARNLYWVRTAAKWELHGHRGVHVCNTMQTSNSFEVEDVS